MLSIFASITSFVLVVGNKITGRKAGNLHYWLAASSQRQAAFAQLC